MYIGNIMLLILNLPLVNLFISILKVPRKLLLPLIAVICLIGVYSIGSSYLDLVILAVLGIAGYAIRGTGYEPAPLVLALVLGPMIETALRQSLKLTRGDIGPIIFRPICIVIYSILILSFLVPAVINLFMQRRKGTTGQYSHQE
jgi:putative tricarboxylic transport membrane protein